MNTLKHSKQYIFQKTRKVNTLKTFKTIYIPKDTQSEHPNNIQKNKQTIQILKDTQSEHPKTFKRTKNLYSMK